MGEAVFKTLIVVIPLAIWKKVSCERTASHPHAVLPSPNPHEKWNGIIVRTLTIMLISCNMVARV